MRSIDLNEWFESQRKISGNLKKLLQERIEKAYVRRELTAEETKCFHKFKGITDKLTPGENAKPSASNVTKPRFGVEISVVGFAAVANTKQLITKQLLGKGGEKIGAGELVNYLQTRFFPS